MQVVIKFCSSSGRHKAATRQPWLALAQQYFFFHPSTFIAPSIQAFAHKGQNLRYMGVCFYRSLVLLGDTPIHIRRCKCRCPSQLCTNLEFRVDFLENFAKSRRNSPHSNFRRFYSHFSLEQTRLTTTYETQHREGEVFLSAQEIKIVQKISGPAEQICALPISYIRLKNRSNRPLEMVNPSSVLSKDQLYLK